MLGTNGEDEEEGATFVDNIVRVQGFVTWKTDWLRSFTAVAFGSMNRMKAFIDER